MIAFVGVCVALVVYPLVAGFVFRALGAPKPCGGKNMAPKYGALPCDGPWGGLWDHGGSCTDCQTVHRATRSAWLWPVAWIVWVPSNLFALGANLTTPPTPEQQKYLAEIEAELDAELGADPGGAV